MGRVWLLCALLLSASCTAPTETTTSAATSSTDVWRVSGGVHPVAFTGQTTLVLFEREGTPNPNAAPRSVHISAQCQTCVSAARVEFDAKTATVEADTGVAEALSGLVVFPEVGTWVFDPLIARLPVRSPTSTEPPVVGVRPWSPALLPNCGTKEIADVLNRLARAYDPANSGDLARVFPLGVDFSMSGEPLPKFVARDREEASRYISDRSRLGERLYPYLTYAASSGANAIDLSVRFTRVAPDLPSVPGQASGYRQGTAGSRLQCGDSLLSRFNADLPTYRP